MLVGWYELDFSEAMFACKRHLSLKKQKTNLRQINKYIHLTYKVEARMTEGWTFAIYYQLCSFGYYSSQKIVYL